MSQGMAATCWVLAHFSGGLGCQGKASRVYQAQSSHDLVQCSGVQGKSDPYPRATQLSVSQILLAGYQGHQCEASGSGEVVVSGYPVRGGAGQAFVKADVCGPQPRATSQSVLDCVQPSAR